MSKSIDGTNDPIKSRQSNTTIRFHERIESI
jgi:hypothetical protein